MIATMPDVQPQGRYSAKEVCAALGICRETLRKWVLAGKIRQRVSRATTLPRYLGADIISLWKAEF